MYVAVFEVSNCIYNSETCGAEGRSCSGSFAELDQLNCLELLNQWSNTTNSLLFGIVHLT